MILASIGPLLFAVAGPFPGALAVLRVPAAGMDRGQHARRGKQKAPARSRDFSRITKKHSDTGKERKTTQRTGIA